MANLIETITSDLIAAIKNDTLVLPTLPEVALQVREAAENVDTSISDLTQIISQDAALSARIIRAANSPLVRISKHINDLSTAINRLGINFTSNLALGLAMEQMFQATSDIVDKRMRRTWRESTEVASICHVLATHFTRLEADQAMLGGLVHKIGVLPVLTYVEEHQELLNDAFALDKLIDKLYPILGGHILKAWQFPKELAIIPTQHLAFDRTVKQTDYTDIVTVAMLHTLADSNHPFTKLDWSNIGAFERLGLQPDIDISEAADIDEQALTSLFS